MGGPSVPGRGRLTDAGLAPRERLGLPQRPASKGEPDRLPVESLPRRESQESDRSLHVRGAPPGGDKPWTLERRAHEFHTPLQHTRGRQLALPRNPDCIMVGTTGRPSQSVHETSVRLDPRCGRTVLVGRMCLDLGGGCHNEQAATPGRSTFVTNRIKPRRPVPLRPTGQVGLMKHQTRPWPPPEGPSPRAGGASAGGGYCTPKARAGKGSGRLPQGPRRVPCLVHMQTGPFRRL